MVLPLRPGTAKRPFHSIVTPEWWLRGAHCRRLYSRSATMLQCLSLTDHELILTSFILVSWAVVITYHTLPASRCIIRTRTQYAHHASAVEHVCIVIASRFPVVALLFAHRYVPLSRTFNMFAVICGCKPILLLHVKCTSLDIVADCYGESGVPCSTSSNHVMN